MSDGYSFTQEQTEAASAAGFSSPDQQKRQSQLDEQARRIASSGDPMEAGIMTGARTAEEFTVEQRQERSQVETMFSGSGLTPWHRLPNAKVIPGTATSIEALTESGLDWKVIKHDVQLIDAAVRREDSPVPACALVRETDGKVLGAAGRRYQPLQNADLFAIGDALVANGARWETAGSLEGGKRVWALMKLSENDQGDEIVPGDRVETFLLLANAHDGTRAAEMILTTVRVVCKNTFRLASEGGLSFRYRHTAKVADRMAAGGEILKAAAGQRERFVEASKKLAATYYTSDAQMDFLAQALGIVPEGDKARTPQMTKKLAVARAMLDEEREIAAQPDSLWTAFNAVTRYTSHAEKAVRGGDLERRVTSLVDGDLAQIATRAFEEALEIAEVQQARTA